MYTFKQEHNLYDWISVLLYEKLYFGPYPNSIMVNKLREYKFNFIIDLTEEIESEFHGNIDAPTFSYINYVDDSKEELKRIKYPIKDGCHPLDPLDYSNFIYFLYLLVLQNKKIYINCLGGHSRSGMICISLMSILMSYDIKKALNCVIFSHNSRENLRPIWKTKKSTLNYNQFLFLKRIHKNIYVNINDFSRNFYKWLLPSEKFLDIIKNNDKITEYDKKELFDYFFKKFQDNKYYLCKLKFTYMRKVILADISEEISNIFYNVILNIRGFFIKNTSV